MFKRFVQLAVIAFCSLTMLAASNFNDLGHQLVCQCGCGEILLECNHVGCPVSPVMIKELQTNMAAGMSDSRILNWFVNKYGPVVLAAPIRGGFDDVAWIVPFAALLLGIIAVIVIMRLWSRRKLAAAAAHAGAAPVAGGTALRERVRRETNYE